MLTSLKADAKALSLHFYRNTYIVFEEEVLHLKSSIRNTLTTCLGT